MILVKSELKTPCYQPPRIKTLMLNGSYSVGDRFDLVLNETAGDRRPDANGVKWYLNDEPASGSVTFNSAGIHTITARFRTMDGHQKVVELEVDVR